VVSPTQEAGTSRATTPFAPLESSPSSYSLCSAKRRHVSPSGSPSTSQGSIVTAISLEVSDTFDGRSNTAYKHWLEGIQPTATMPEYVSFIDEKVAVESPFRLCGRITLTRSVIFSVCCLVYRQPHEQTTQNRRNAVLDDPTEVLVRILMV
jgi:hypothetical protein